MSGKPPLPVHGFVLAGGKSSRMGRDKALLAVGGRRMIETAVGKLRSFCEDVSIAGNRPDLVSFSPVATEERLDGGPISGIEAGLRASVHSWSLFTPVDVPLVPAILLHNWALAVLGRGQEGVRLSFLSAAGIRQPAFCLLHKDCLVELSRAADAGERKLGAVFALIASTLGAGALWVAEAEAFAPEGETHATDLEVFFNNVNTPEDLSALQALSKR